MEGSQVVAWHILGDRLIPVIRPFEFSGILHVTHYKFNF